MLPDDDRREQQAGRLAVLHALGVSPNPGVDRLLEIGAGGGQFAAAACAAGWQVTALELVRVAAESASRRLANFDRGTVVHADAYTVSLPYPFHTVCYWDGFGIGDDTDQTILLSRIRDWLVPGGSAVVEVYAPWYWHAAAGREQAHAGFRRRYDFEVEDSRMVDTWYPPQGEPVTQSLRCYSPADLRLLLSYTGLRLAQIQPGGATMEQSLSYIALLECPR